MSCYRKIKIDRPYVLTTNYKDNLNDKIAY